MYSGTEVVVLILCAPVSALLGYLAIKWYRYKKDQELRELVRRLMSEYREARKQQVECPHCLYGRTWRPEIIAEGFPIDSEEPWMEDCLVCEGDGFLPKAQMT